MRFIRLTNKLGEYIWINVGLIESFGETDGGCSFIITNGMGVEEEPYTVKESPREILKLLQALC